MIYQLCKLVETKTSGLMGKQQTLLYFLFQQLQKSADANGREDFIMDFADELDMTPLGMGCDR